MDRGREKYMHALSTQTNTQSMVQDNNSPAENAHNVISGALGQWIG